MPLEYSSTMQRLRKLGKQVQLQYDISALTRDLAVAARREKLETVDAPRVAAAILDLEAVTKRLPAARELAAKGDLQARFCVEDLYPSVKAEVDGLIRRLILAGHGAGITTLGFSTWARRVIRSEKQRVAELERARTGRRQAAPGGTRSPTAGKRTATAVPARPKRAAASRAGKCGACGETKPYITTSGVCSDCLDRQLAARQR